MLKVVFIADVGLAGGATKSLIEVVTTLKNNHNIVPVVLTSQNSEMNAKLTELGIENHVTGHCPFMQGEPDAKWKKPVKWILFAMKYCLSYKSSFNKALAQVDWDSVDLIHTNVARLDIGMRIAKEKGIPSITHIREFAELDFNCWSYRPHYVSYLADNNDGFIAISNAVRDYWVQKGIPKDKITVIYNGVDYTKIACADHGTWESDKALKLVIAGGVIPNKGQWQAIDAICGLPDDIVNNIRLDVMGGITETYQAKLSEPLKKRGILDQVSFLGACSDVYDRLKDYHIGLMCSKAEGFGRVTVEYMHAGLGVIASDTGANPELINDGENGLLYKRSDTATLTDAIRRLYEDRKLLISIADNGKASAAEKFRNDINAKNIYEYYLKMTKKGNGHE